VLLQQPLLQQLEGGDVHARVGDDANLRGQGRQCGFESMGPMRDCSSPNAMLLLHYRWKMLQQLCGDTYMVVMFVRRPWQPFLVNQAAAHILTP
jgi:hypothetical protein